MGSYLLQLSILFCSYYQCPTNTLPRRVAKLVALSWPIRIQDNRFARVKLIPAYWVIQGWLLDFRWAEFMDLPIRTKDMCHLELIHQHSIRLWLVYNIIYYFFSFHFEMDSYRFHYFTCKILLKLPLWAVDGAKGRAGWGGGGELSNIFTTKYKWLDSLFAKRIEIEREKQVFFKNYFQSRAKNNCWGRTSDNLNKKSSSWGNQNLSLKIIMIWRTVKFL